MAIKPHSSIPTSNEDVPLGDADVRAIVRLLGEALTVRGSASEVKRFLMDGLCELIGADRWLWGLCQQAEKDGMPIPTSLDHGGFTDEGLAQFLVALGHPEMSALQAPFFQEIAVDPRHLTRTRQQIDPEARFVRSNAYTLWKKADVGPALLSMRPLDEKCGSMVALYRRFDRDLFNAREARIAHIILTEIPWLHEQGWPEDRDVEIPRLTPRQRVILNLLLEGQTRKAIANHLNISLNTVQGYIRQIYSFFSVQSHAQLIRRFQQGNGGDRR